MPVYRGNFSTNELCKMGDAVLANPHGQEQLSVRLNEGMETFESGIAPHPVENHIPPMSMEAGLDLIDAWMARQQVQIFNDAIDVNSRIERNNHYLGSEDGFPADWLDRYELKIHKRLIDLHSSSETVKQIVSLLFLTLHPSGDLMRTPDEY
jgi:Ribosomal protein S10p/S20e